MFDFWKPTLDVFDSWPLQIKNIQTERYVSNIYNDWKTLKGSKILIPSWVGVEQLDLKLGMFLLNK